MKLTKDICKLSIDAIQDVYNGYGYKIGSTEFNSIVVDCNGQLVQMIPIGGTKGLIDWFWNIFIVSKNGVKYCSEVSAQRIFNEFIRFPGLPLVITGHSKAGPTACRLHQLLNADLCIAFCPTRGFDKPVKMQNTTIFIDPDDPVPELADSIFFHPDCDMIYLKDNPGLIDISHHSLDHIKSSINDLDF